MAEVSSIIINGQSVNLKDATGRALLAEKQIKLKAGDGISISEDGIISVTEISKTDSNFIITASGELANLSFDRTPAEVQTAVDNGSLVIVKANNARFVLADIKDNTYLFSYIIAAGDECFAQIATIIATHDTDVWTSIKTEFVTISLASEEKEASGSIPDTSITEVPDCDDGNNFADWGDFEADSVIIIGNTVEENSAGLKYNNVDPDNYWSSDYASNEESNVDISVEDIKDSASAKITIDGKTYLIADKTAREEFETLQDILVLSDDFIIAADGTISLAEGAINEQVE